jgi:hypothetical protein
MMAHLAAKCTARMADGEGKPKAAKFLGMYEQLSQIR